MNSHARKYFLQVRLSMALCNNTFDWLSLLVRLQLTFCLLLRSFASTMPPPQCPGPCGGTKRTELESAALRKKWAAQEGLSWSWLSFPNRPRACAYWHLCRQCHQKAFPLDNRTRNRHSRPWEMVWDSRVLDRHRGLSRLTV